MTKPKINTFPATPGYIEWCEANGLDPNDENNQDSYSEWKANNR
jgi:hypothetical protein